MPSTALGIFVWAAWIAIPTAAFASLGARTRLQLRRAVEVGVLAGGYIALLFVLRLVQSRVIGPGHYPWLGKSLVTAIVIGASVAGVGPSPSAIGVTSLGRGDS